MTELIELVLSNPQIRAFFEEIAVKVSEGVVIKVIGEIFHRRRSSPEFCAASDAIFTQLANAETDEERTNAQLALQRLMSGN